MKIAVTGASGFIGTELLAVLQKQDNIETIALARSSSGHEDTDRCRWRGTDYSVESLTEALDGADVVVHLAGVRGTENDPEKFAVNCQMTENILKAMTAAGAGRIVFASTMSVYNDDSLMPWTEEAPLRGRSCYGDSKADCEQFIAAYAAENGITYGIARIAQVLGLGEKRRGMMNVFIDTAREKGVLTVMGRSVVKKQFIYVKDLANILLLLACGGESFCACENIIVNAGMADAYTNLEIAQIVNRVYENDTPINYDDSYPERGRPFLMNTDRLRKELGYAPLDMEEALRKIKEEQ